MDTSPSNVPEAKTPFPPAGFVRRERTQSVPGNPPYIDPDRPDVARVPILTHKHAGMEAIIDAADLPLIEGKRWNFSPGSNRPISAGSVVLAMNVSPKPTLSRIIMGVTDPDLQVTHVNGDRLDCRRENLIVRTRSEVAKARKPSMETVERLRPYPDPTRAGVWRVPLKSHLAYREALIDEGDLPIVQGRNWNWGPRSDDSSLVDGTVLLASCTSQTPLARLILGAEGKNERVRFLNGDPLDCRRENIALLTLTEQVRGNAKMGSASGRKYTSNFKGVCWDEPRGKWKAQIRCEGVHRSIGRFRDEIAAAEAYDEAARELFGEHARLNFPDGVDTWLKRAAA